MKESLESYFGSDEVSIHDALEKWFDLANAEKKRFEVTIATICDRCKIGIVQKYCEYESIDSYQTVSGYKCVCCAAESKTPFGSCEIIPCSIYNRQEWPYYSVLPFEKAQSVPDEIERRSRRNEALLKEIQKIKEDADGTIRRMVQEKISLSEEMGRITREYEKKVKELRQEADPIKKDVEKANWFPFKLLPGIKQKNKRIQEIESEIKDISSKYDLSIKGAKSRMMTIERALRESRAIQSDGGYAIGTRMAAIKENQERIGFISKKYSDFLNS